MIHIAQDKKWQVKFPWVYNSYLQPSGEPGLLLQFRKTFGISSCVSMCICEQEADMKPRQHPRVDAVFIHFATQDAMVRYMPAA